MTIRVRRYSPEVAARPWWQQYEVQARPKASLLDALYDILQHQDSTLAFRCSCGSRACGSCAMVINGREGLACGTRLETLGSMVTVEPLRHMPVIKDLVVDMAPFFARYAAVKPYFVGGVSQEIAVVPPDSGLREIIDQQLGCITCGACFSACPIVSINPGYLGPAALNRAYCLEADMRDGAPGERLAIVSGDDGIFCCRNVSNCVEVCPHRIEPMLSVQRLRKRALLRRERGTG